MRYLLRFFALPVLLLFYSATFGQIYEDYVGGGHSDGITVTASSNYQPWGWEQVALAENTITGKGLEGKLMEASRFLA
ncbi:MAG: hypothetical protein DRI72_05440, partial [Bacteroidetes bacterium]